MEPEALRARAGIRIITGDSRTVLATLPSASVQCSVTSPPYYNLRSYLAPDDPDKALEIGQEQTPDAYVAELVAVFREVRRVLADDGCVFLNLGDSYHRTPTTNVPQTKNPKVGFPSSLSRSSRVAACDKPGKAPASSQGHDCLC